jgi:hypothetical protein
MAMFTRRALQRMLDHLAAHLPLKARQKLASEMNRQSDSTLGFEWETALLFGFSHIGKIEYEAPASTTSHPDITFAETSKTPVCFTADVATVSDEGLEEKNPATRFSMALSKLQQKYKLTGSTHFTIKGEATGPHYRDRKMHLKLPPGGHQVEKMLEKHLAPIFKRIQKEKLPTASIAINEPGVEVTIKYNANERYGSGSYPSYTTAYSLKRNPVYSTLKDKLGQLKRLKSENPLGIFLCDGGCALLKSMHGAGGAVSIQQVIREFFRQNSSLSFVVTLTFPPSSVVTFGGAVKELRIAAQVYVNPRTKSAPNSDALFAVINRALTQLPPPCAIPQDALYWIRNSNPHEGQPIHILTHGATTMTISARRIQEALAGKITPMQLFGEYGRPDAPCENLFARALNQGLTIESVKLTRMPEADDDLLEFRFAPDPAIRKFVADGK